MNTTLDDIAGEIGFTAAVRIATWYGGTNMYVPAHPNEDMTLVRLVGMAAARRLADVWGGCPLAVPTMWVYEEQQRNLLIANMVAAGLMCEEVARRVGITERRVQQVCRDLRAIGLLAPSQGRSGPRTRRPTRSADTPGGID